MVDQGTCGLPQPQSRYSYGTTTCSQVLCSEHACIGNTIQLHAPAEPRANSTHPSLLLDSGTQAGMKSTHYNNWHWAVAAQSPCNTTSQQRTRYESNQLGLHYHHHKFKVTTYALQAQARQLLPPGTLQVTGVSTGGPAGKQKRCQAPTAAHA